MPTLIEYFKNDFPGLATDTDSTISYQIEEEKAGTILNFQTTIKVKVIQLSHNSSKFFVFYIPKTDITFLICKNVIENFEQWKNHGNIVEAIDTYTGDKTVGIHSIVYSNRVYFYTEILLDDSEISQMDIIAKEKKLFLTFRSSDYISKKAELEKPFAFISHDSNDKALIAEPLAKGLNSRLCFVWYDEFTLKVGDSLRESIEKGIKEAKKCILVLTPNFLKNPGWTKKEFNSIFTREIIFNERIILPIWCNVTKEEVYDYSPSLAETFALIWPNESNLEKEEYNKEVEKLISKLHTAITK
ncbi:MAG: TIR domain-containing protein [Ignavibacteria bacterium]|nr:TIR domain-containing protein [Ignavibacteria bacterium]